MIELVNINKKLYKKKVLDNITLKIPNACVFGILTDTKQASTELLRLISGITVADSGFLYIDGQPIFDNIPIKENVFLVASEPFFIHNSTFNGMVDYYKMFYHHFNEVVYKYLLKLFEFNGKTRIDKLPLPKRKQAALIFGLSFRPKYLLIDDLSYSLSDIQKDAIDLLVKDNIMDFGQTIILTSTLSNDIKDYGNAFAIIKDGKLFSTYTNQNSITDMTKLQIVFDHNQKLDFKKLNVIEETLEGVVATFILKNGKEEVLSYIKELKPLKYAFLNLNLTEVYKYYDGDLTDENK